MNIRYVTPLILLLALLPGLGTNAQERLLSVASNPALERIDQVAPVKTGSQDTLNLPFIDDFSSNSPIPEVSRWINRSAYVNYSFPLNPPTYGVATLDAIDSAGAVYPSATVQSFLADDLTSRPIRLFLPGDTTVYLSFFYQPQGFGDAPEPGDSLVVEFYAPDSHKWLRMWSTPGTASHDFRIAMINITDTRFLQDGFRFRFRNYASLAPSYEPSLKVNADHWNIDYVYLNTGRRYNDTIMKDAALVEPVRSLLQNYTAMPWEHFRLAGISAVKAIFQITLNNLSVDRRAFTPIFRIDPVWGTGSGFSQTYPADEVKAFESLKYDAAFNYGFASDERDSALFEISLDMNQTDTDQIPANDKIISEQLFADYYAYDDGSAEAGYGLVGEGTRTARLAYRYTNLNNGDSLFAVDFYFNRSFADASRKFFKLAVWKDNNNAPGELIYQQDGAVPKYNGISQFQRIELDTAQVVNGVYYIGWIQTTADALNIGFDRHNNRKQDIFYNIAGSWQPTSFEGALMIRPVFANKSRKSGTGPTLTANPAQEVKVYPNPSSDQVRVDCGAGSEILRITLTDLQGRLVSSFLEAGPSCRISVADLPNGIYLIQVQSDSGLQARQKLIVFHE